MEFLIDFIFAYRQAYLIEIVQDYHTWAYAILFMIIFCETGLVVTPFTGRFFTFCRWGYYSVARNSLRNKYFGTYFVCCCGIGRFL